MVLAAPGGVALAESSHAALEAVFVGDARMVS